MARPPGPGWSRLARVLLASTLLVLASVVVPTVKHAGICAFVPCDPGPKDATVGFARDGHTALLILSPCAPTRLRRVEITSLGEPRRRLWAAERARPGDERVIHLVTPPPDLRVVQEWNPGELHQVEITVVYTRGRATSWGSFDDVRPSQVSLFKTGGESLGAFDRQAQDGSVCRWYASPVERIWPPLAAGSALVLGGVALEHRRRARKSFRQAIAEVFLPR